METESPSSSQVEEAYRRIVSNLQDCLKEAERERDALLEADR